MMRNNLIKKSKKAYLRTVEIVIAFVLTFWFVNFAILNIIPQNNDVKLYPLHNFEVNNKFRGCVINENVTCIDNFIKKSNPEFVREYDYQINFTSLKNPIVKNPHTDIKQNIYVDSMIIAGNSSVYNPKIIYLRYWRAK